MGYSDPPGLSIMNKDILFEKSPKVYRLPADMPHPFADLLAEHRILSIEEPKGELREMSLVEIRHQFSVDVANKKLVRQKQKS